MSVSFFFCFEFFEKELEMNDAVFCPDRASSVRSP